MIRITVDGYDKVLEALKQAPGKLKQALRAAGDESARRVVLATSGLKRYPASTAANRAGRVREVQFRNGQRGSFRQNFYTRSRGLNVAVRGGGYKQFTESERLGAQWTVRSANSGLQTEIGNRASYASILHGDEQAGWADRYGWRQLADVVEQKTESIQIVYQAWIDKLIKEIGL